MQRYSSIGLENPFVNKSSAFLALLFLVPVPTLGLLSALYFPLTAGHLSGQIIFFIAKIWLLLFPLFWVLFHDKWDFKIPRPSTRGFSLAILTGVSISVFIALVYYLYFKSVLDLDFLSEKVLEAGLNSKFVYILMAIYWSTINSLLEEYVWRWFVFKKCRVLFNGFYWLPILASGFFFSIHHFFALYTYIPNLYISLLASLGVLIGGVTWSWLYLRSKNIYAAYLSHFLVDVIIFWIGYEIIFLS